MGKSIIAMQPVKELLYIIILLRQEKYDVKFSALQELVINKIDRLTEVLSKDTLVIQVDHLKYLLCAAFDEAYFMNKKAGLNYENTKSLINYYYDEELSGEIFFQILLQLSNDVNKNIPLLELGYLIICLGFMGKYAITENGQDELNILKVKIHSILSQPSAELTSVPTLFINDTLLPQQVENKLRLPAIILSLIVTIILVHGFFLQHLTKKYDELYQLIEQTNV